MSRVYLDWNATAPLRAEARDAMVSALDLRGNPSSVHAEGRAAKAVVERARAQVAAAAGCAASEIVFTSSATEAAALGLAGRSIRCAAVEHDCVAAWCEADLPVDSDGAITAETPQSMAVQAANSETGVIQELPQGLGFVDAVQAFGKTAFAFGWSGADLAALSAHKIGGPKGIGALIVRGGVELDAMLKGGGQEMGRRAGTENVAAIAGFGGAAEAAQRDLESGVWSRVAKLRDQLEAAIAETARDTIFVGKDATRLPNTSCILTPGWKGETQVMQMDLAGIAVSAGSACSSGKVRESRVLRAMGYTPIEASSAIRVSLGPTTTEDEIELFALAWSKAYAKRSSRAA